MPMADAAHLRKRPWLFERFPGLRDRLPWTALAAGVPTPVRRLENISARPGKDIWIKRDDRTSPDYGGNKVRKLEFILAEARATGRQPLVTGGGLGTHHGLATAVFGRKLGLPVVLGLFEQPVTEHVRRNLLLDYAHGAEMLFVGSILQAVVRYYVIEKIRRRGAYFIPPGGSSPLGALGYVDAGLELARQVENEELPEPEAIFVAVGSSGTMAGLLLGLRLADCAIPIVGVQVAPRMFAGRLAVLRLARGALSLLRRFDASVPNVQLSSKDITIERGFYGRGYGHPTDAGRAALELLAETEDIGLDPTYTSKAFAAVLAHARESSTTGPLLFWNTFNSVDLSSMAEGVDFRSLPTPFHRFFVQAL